MWNITIDSIDEMKYLAGLLAKHVKPADVLLLSGDLGAGKTTFSQFFGQELGVTKTINSPTFTIIKSYTGRMPLHHMDTYRLENSDEDLGFDEYFYGDGVTLIEWPEMIKDFLPDHYLTITIHRLSEDGRSVTLEATGRRYEELLEAVKNEIIID